jgi:hypothetical protein
LFFLVYRGKNDDRRGGGGRDIVAGVALLSQGAGTDLTLKPAERRRISVSSP